MAHDLRNLSDLKDYLRNHDLRLRKALSQNFIIDKNILSQLVDRAHLKNDDHILEVGPGLGAITRTLLEKGHTVTAVELDKGFAEHLPGILADYSKTFTLIEGDILKQEFQKPMKVISNIPFQITAPLLEYFVQREDLFDELTLVVQEDLCDRMLAKESTRNNNSFAIYSQYHYEIEKCFTISKTCFFPVPNIECATVFMKRRKNRPLEKKDELLFSKFVRRCFQQKRKMLRSSLKSLNVPSALEKLDLKETSRPEDLSVMHYVELFRLLRTPFEESIAD